MGFLSGFASGFKQGVTGSKSSAKVPAQRQRADVQPSYRPAAGPLVDIAIVGEAAYQDAIRAVQRKHQGREFPIYLRPDPQNRYDRNAVAVLAEHEVVGYLPKWMAPSWQPTVMAAESEGYVITGSAEVFGGTKDKPHLGVFGQATWVGRERPVTRWDAPA